MGDLAANIEGVGGLVDCAGFITALIGSLYARIAPAVTSLD